MTLSITAFETVSSQATTNLSLTHTVAAPRPGDVYIVAFANGGGQTWVPPTGWTSIYSVANGPEATSGSAAWYARAEDAVAPYTWSWGTQQSFHSILFRVTSSLEGGTARVVQAQNSVNATDLAASYTTTSITVTAGNLVTYGIACEGGSATTFTTNGGSDFEIVDTDTGAAGTPEHVAGYYSTVMSGATTRTMTPSSATQVAGMTWVVELKEIATRPSLVVPVNQAVHRASRW